MCLGRNLGRVSNIQADDHALEVVTTSDTFQQLTLRQATDLGYGTIDPPQPMDAFKML
jgi:hypothetical protein